VAVVVVLLVVLEFRAFATTSVKVAHVSLVMNVDSSMVMLILVISRLVVPLARPLVKMLVSATSSRSMALVSTRTSVASAMRRLKEERKEKQEKKKEIRRRRRYMDMTNESYISSSSKFIVISVR